MNQRTWTPTTIYIYRWLHFSTVSSDHFSGCIVTKRYTDYCWLSYNQTPPILFIDYDYISLNCVKRPLWLLCVLWRQGGALIVNCADTSYYPGKWMEYHCRSHPELGKHTRINIEARYCYCSCGGALKARKSESYFFQSGESKIMQI